MRLISFLFFIVAILIALALGSENSHLVDINLLFVKLTLPLSIVLASSVLFGILLTLLSFVIRKVVKKANA
ncbi:LapA family protein [Psychrosphaera aestuarii]